MSISDVVLIIVAAISIIDLYLVLDLSKKVSSIVGDFKNKLSDIGIDSKISTMFTDGGSMKSVDDLASLLFKNIKRHFGFKAKSYAEIIEEIKISPKIKGEMKDALTEFFEEIIHISYRKDVLTEKEEEDFKKKVKIILTRLKEY